MGGVFLIASPGGHIDELYDLTSRLVDSTTRRLWITARTPQTAQLLTTELTEWVPPIASRQGHRALAQLPYAMQLIHRYRPSLVISTGAALAVPHLVASRTLGVPTHYIESATRLEGPSVTGRMMENLPGVRRHHQGFRVPRQGWSHLGSVFDAYRPGPRVSRELRRVVVIVGTERYPFSRALESVARALPGDVEVLYQVGHTPPPDSSASYQKWLPLDELLRAMERADVVVTHAGVGSVLTALRLAKHPLVIPRLPQLGEHVDNHQSQLARMLEAKGLVTVAWRDSDLLPMLTDAAQRSTIRWGTQVNL
ncbi:glycosyltransferase [Ornithinimicrobium pratense]|uniref:Glycosyl transferase family 28 n=1 Tax=Ornithinimicrobium pratense TaxID=2593973 RepID=A0A5J6V9G4_9MICO|nr:glycosyltransferase [Ornithinimicrobium pratense]QFG69783.1 glycosyl transferase family 28 [Ornithinimicrobium pratense]